MRAEYDFSKGKCGALISAKGKTRITIHIDNAVLSEFRARGKGGHGLSDHDERGAEGVSGQERAALTEAVLRRVIREELPETPRTTTRASGRGTKRRAA